MKKIYFSKSTGGFYDPQINGLNIPADAVVITAEVHSTMLDAQASGKRITSDSEGHPLIADRLPPTAEEAAQAIRASALSALEATDLVALRCLKAGVKFPTEWNNYTAALRTIVRSDTPTTTLPTPPAYPANT